LVGFNLVTVILRQAVEPFFRLWL